MQLLPQTTIPAAGTYLSQVIDFGGKAPKLLAFFMKFLYGAGGTTINVYVQTSFDGVTFYDSLSFAQITTSAKNLVGSTSPTATDQFPALTDAGLSAGTGLPGMIGRYWRVKYVVVGTYTGASSLEVDAFGSN